MNIEPRSQLRQGLFALDRSHCHFGLECRRMIAAGSLRHKSPSFQAISSLGLDGVATYPVVSRSGASSLDVSAGEHTSRAHPPFAAYGQNYFAPCLGSGIHWISSLDKPSGIATLANGASTSMYHRVMI